LQIIFVFRTELTQKNIEHQKTDWIFKKVETYLGYKIFPETVNPIMGHPANLVVEPAVCSGVFSSLRISSSRFAKNLTDLFL